MENQNKKNIGIMFPPRSGNGGIFQYAMSVAEALANFCDEYNYTVFYFDETSPKDALMIKNKENINFVALKKREENLLFKAGIAVGILTRKPIFPISKWNKKLIEKANLDLMIITSPLLAGFEHNVPFIFPILDVMYLNYRRYFKEYSELKTWIVSQVVIKDLADRAELNIDCSEWDKNDIIKFLKQPKNKLITIKMVPPGYIYFYKDMVQEEVDELVRKYNLPEKFLFYPAQFFPHKNHLRLIESINIIKEKYGENVNLVLAGNPKVNVDNYNKVKELIKKYNLENQVFILGYIEDKEVVALYKKSISLILPTFSGPTNLTPWEAMILGTVVLCSNLFDMPEQVGDAGIVFDPRDPNDMAEKIKKVWQDENLRKKLIEEGYKLVKDLTLENYAKQWISAVKSVTDKQKL